jgi:hypothetical protein
MSLRSLAVVLFTGFLITASGPALLAQKAATNQDAVAKEERKGLRITNDSSEPKQVLISPGSCI